MRTYRAFLEGREIGPDGLPSLRFNLDIRATDEHHARTIINRAHSYWHLAGLVEVIPELGS